MSGSLGGDGGRRRSTTVREFRRSDQAAARALLEDGLGQHFGFIDRNAYGRDDVDVFLRRRI